MEKRGVYIPSKYIVFVFLLLLTSLHSLFNGKSNFAYSIEYVNLIFAFLTFYMGYSLYTKQRDDLIKSLKICFIVLSFFCSLTVLEFFSQISILNHPNPAFRLSETGFTDKRTGWSGAIAQFIPLAILFLKGKRLSKVVMLMLPIFGSQIVTGGRGGLLASLVCLLFLIARSFKGSKFLILVGFLLVLGYFSVDFFITQFRVTEDLSQLTSYRYDQYLLIPEALRSGGILGLGLGGSDRFLSAVGIPYELHNVWFRLFIDHGLVHGFLAILLFAFAIKQVLIKADSLSPTLVFQTIILVGLITSQLEPRLIFGGFQVSFLWYLALGCLLADKRNVLSSQIAYRTEL